MEMTKTTTDKAANVFKQIKSDARTKAPGKLRKFRGYKELVPDPYGLRI